MTEVFLIKYINAQDCFLHLNKINIQKKCFSATYHVKVQYGEDFSREHYFSYHPRHSEVVASNMVGISAVYALKLGIVENEKVLITSCSAPSLNTVYVRPKSEENNDILVDFKQKVEECMLDQIRVVVVKQTLPIQVSRYIHLDVVVDKLVPDLQFGLLEADTEFVVLDPLTSSNNVTYSDTGSAHSKLDDRSTNTSRGGEEQTDLDKENLFTKLMKFIMFLLKIIVPSERAKMLLRKQEKGDEGEEEEAGNYVLRALKRSQTYFDRKKTNNYFHVLPLSALEEIPSVLVSSNRNCVLCLSRDWYYQVNKNVHGSIGYKVLSKIVKVKEITSLKVKNKEVPRGESAVNHAENSELSCPVFAVCCDNSQENSDRLYVPVSVMKELELEVGSFVMLQPALEKVQPKKVQKTSSVIEKDDKIRVHSLWESLSVIEQSILKTITTNQNKLGPKLNIVVVGNHGTGKSYLLDTISEQLEKVYFIYSLKLDCKPLKGKKAESLETILVEKLSLCAYHEPSVLLLDDLDGVTQVNSLNDQESSFNQSYTNRVGSMLSETITKFQANNQITVVATCQNLAGLGSELNSSRGPRLFESVFEMPGMCKTDRVTVLRNIIDKSNTGMKLSVNESMLEGIADETESYNVQDLVDLMEKIVLKSLVRQNNCLTQADTIELLTDDFQIALSESVPLSLRGIELHKDIPHVWEDVGGLNEAKQVLMEVLQWPSQYAELFASCPLRHQSGVLLYGAPGTGKTLIIGAAAQQCKLNFISIKGPELLSKYVGASEEGVRNLFQRAQKAKPCILFFDEFDSLAPRRGHDSTGVTDRVVNQLLTQLDGVESLTGVWVLAATSRPDLLDPALLRPGRLDRAVYCSLPNKVERVSILNALSRNMNLPSDIDLKEIADKTEGYTGADLHAVLYNAQMSAIKEVTKQRDSGDLSLSIKQEHLLKAVKETKPSLSPSEILRYHLIYERFLGSGGADFAEKFSRSNQRVTLA